jgi:predicted nucleotidyltransferase
MDHPPLQLSPLHQSILDRFIAICQADERVIASLLTGSYARGTADAYSDLDFCLITRTEAYENFIGEKEEFINQIGETLFVDDFNHPDMILVIFTSGVECELAISSPGRLDQLYCAPYRLLLDKKGLFSEAGITPSASPPADQVEALRKLVSWFWHDLSHFITALGRGQLWWAAGQLEALRGYCVSLARLRHDFSAEAALDEPYFKIEIAMHATELAPLQDTFCPLAPIAMLQAALTILHFYQELAPPLARAHGLTYPHDLERLMLARLEKVSSELT